MAATQTETNIESLFKQIDAALVSREHDELKTTLFTAVKTRRSLELPADNDLYRKLYTSIGDLKFALSEARQAEVKEVATPTQQAHQALQKSTIPALVAAKRQLREALANGCSSGTKQALKKLSRRLTSAIDALNDAAARALIEQFNTQSQQVWDAVDAKELLRASVGFNQLERIALQILKPQTFMQYTIDRIEAGNGGWEAVSQATEKSVTETKKLVCAFEMEAGKVYAKAAHALATRLDACIANENIGGARSAFRQLSEPNNAAGLATYLDDKDKYMADAGVWLRTKESERFNQQKRKSNGQANRR